MTKICFPVASWPISARFPYVNLALVNESREGLDADCSGALSASQGACHRESSAILWANIAHFAAKNAVSPHTPSSTFFPELLRAPDDAIL